jgi:hypothetical protein
LISKKIKIFKEYLTPTERKERQNDPTKVIKTPMIAGGLFVINKKYFHDLGEYDQKMDIWVNMLKVFTLLNNTTHSIY